VTGGGVAVERDVEVPMRDGTSLRADVHRPRTGGDLPVLLHRTPYDKTFAQTNVYQHPAWYAAHGYVVVACDVRGRFASDGRFDPFRHEAADGFDSIEWAARLPGTTGRVGTYGFSYAGATQLLAATEAPPALACMAPAMTPDDFYDGWCYRGGAFQLAFVVSWCLEALAIPELLRRGEREAARRVAVELRRGAMTLIGDHPLQDHPLLRDAGVEWLFDWLEHDTRDPYWSDVGLLRRAGAIDVPCLHIGGWYDTFVEGTLRLHGALRERGRDPERQRLVVGPWLHVPWSRRVGIRDFGSEAANAIDELQLRWFDRWLKDAAPATAEDPVKYFVMGEDAWRSAATWPPPEVEARTFYLHSSGRALSDSGDGRLRPDAPQDDGRPDVFVYLPGLPVPSAGGRSCCSAGSSPMGPACQCEVEGRNDVLVYTTAPFAEPTLLAGPAHLALFAATDRVDTDWTAKLVHVDAEGKAINLCGGIVRARFRESLEHPEPLTPGEVVRYRIDVGTTAMLVRAGEALRLEVSSSEHPTYDANVNTGAASLTADVFDALPATQRVYHDVLRPSHLIVHVAAGQVRDAHQPA